MITFDLFYDQFNQEDYYPDEIHVGRYKANSIEELESKIEKLNKRALWEESRYLPQNWHYEIVDEEVEYLKEPEDFLVALVISFNIEKNYLDAYITSSGWDYETAIDNMTPGTKYTEYLSSNIKEVKLFTIVDPEKYSCWLDLYDGELEGALKRAEHYINWSVYKEEVKKNLLAKIDKYRKDLKARDGKFKRFKSQDK